MFGHQRLQEKGGHGELRTQQRPTKMEAGKLRCQQILKKDCESRTGKIFSNDNVYDQGYRQKKIVSQTSPPTTTILAIIRSGIYINYNH